jgi:methylthioribulose-1-phosphate dehydratase
MTAILYESEGPERWDDPRPLLMSHARAFYDRGWMWGTAGNLSARLADGSFWITASGCSKGELTLAQFVHLTVEGQLLPQLTSTAKPSAETSIHQVIYQHCPEAQACYHVHSIAANLVSRLTTADTLQLPTIEMLKGLGVWETNPIVYLDLFPNHPQVPYIAELMGDRLQQKPPQIPACLIRDHGVTVWGNNPAEARNRIEVMEFIFQFIVTAHTMGLNSSLHSN